ncbi:MAG: 4Fe-4S dicluster domain-containing protein [Planctomycetia bacterium]|nr:4Fe-4S dicluster domain-containing protein [Planctomycetia bacterium]
MLRKTRIFLASLVGIVMTLMFLDFTGNVAEAFGFLAKIQFLPAVLAGSMLVVVGLLVVTLLWGRVYCSVICPMGILQDLISRLGGRGRKNRFGWKPAHTVCRWTVLVLFVGLIATGFSAVAMLLAPYSLFGRTVSTFLSPLYRWGNNLLAMLPESVHDYWLVPVEISAPAVATTVTTTLLFLLVAVLAWRGGRTYCNTFCPVGTLLGCVARFSFWKPRIDTDRCNGCGKCARNCKAACIDPKAHRIDASRCVACFDCLENCPSGALKYTLPLGKKGVETTTEIPKSGLERRQLLTLAMLLATGGTSLAAEKKEEKIKFDGGLTKLVPRETPTRTVSPTPPGSGSPEAFAQRCVACQLCVQGCPNHVLRSSDGLKTFYQPQMIFTQGYCRPECHHCSDVCPTGAIRKITESQKETIQIGYAVWMRDQCVVLTDGVPCGNCERHCPSQAIEMVPSDPTQPESLKVPLVQVEKCIGCGSCEYHCPARPQSAIYVEGTVVHTEKVSEVQEDEIGNAA